MALIININYIHQKTPITQQTSYKKSSFVTHTKKISFTKLLQFLPLLMKCITNLLATRSSCLDGALSSVGKNVTPVRAICKKKKKKIH